MAPDAAIARDAGLRRISVFTRLAAAAGLALTGVFSAAAAHAFPFQDRSAPRAGSTAYRTSAQARVDDDGWAYDDQSENDGSTALANPGPEAPGLQPPLTPPGVSPGPSVVISGGS